MEMKRILVFVLLLLVTSQLASAYFFPYGPIQFQHAGGGVYRFTTVSFSPNSDLRGPDMAMIFAPEEKKFCHTYLKGGSFPIADYFGEDRVSVEYLVDREQRQQFGWGRGNQVLSGEVIFRKGSCSGEFIDNADFRSTFSWDDPYSLDGEWPRYFAPGVQKLEFELKINGHGSFEVDKQNGRWSWQGTSFGQPIVSRGDRWTERLINRGYFG